MEKAVSCLTLAQAADMRPGRAPASEHVAETTPVSSRSDSRMLHTPSTSGFPSARVLR